MASVDQFFRKADPFVDMERCVSQLVIKACLAWGGFVDTDGQHVGEFFIPTAQCLARAPPVDQRIKELPQSSLPLESEILDQMQGYTEKTSRDSGPPALIIEAAKTFFQLSSSVVSAQENADLVAAEFMALLNHTRTRGAHVRSAALL